MSVLLPKVRGGHLLNLGRKFLGIRNFADAADGDRDERKGLILGVYTGENDENVLSPAAQKVNTKMEGRLVDLLKQSEATIKKGDARVFNNLTSEFWSIALVGLGKEKQGYNEMEAIDDGMESVRMAAGLGSQLLMVNGVTRIAVEGFHYPEQAAEGSALAVWRYQENKNRYLWRTIPTLELFDDPDAGSFMRGLFKAESQNLARRLSDTPANMMTPLHFAQEAINELCPCGLKVDVHDKDWIEAHRFNAFLAVARGSCEPPVLLEISYCGGPDNQRPVLICGKGCTFDSGGLCLKRCNKMDRMRASMCGAAVIIGAVRAAAALSLPINIKCVIPLCENMISGMAMKCGDVVQGMNGKSIMIVNTDHEGHLMLADALCYGQAQFKPRLIIDVADLTLGAKQALGSAAAAVFCNSQTMWSQVRKAGVITGDRVWRMPIWKFYSKKVTNFRSHDVDNQGRGYGEPCLGAAFLNEFVTCVDWMHFDITGVGKFCENKVYSYYTKKRMTGRPTRTLTQLLYQLSCPPDGQKNLLE